MKEVYGVKFVYHGNTEFIEQDKAFKSYAEGIFISMHNTFATMANPWYEKWNAEFDEIYPGKDGDSEEYRYFIKCKQLPIVDIINKEYIPDGVRKDKCIHAGIGKENNLIIYIPIIGNFETGDYVEFFLTK